MRNIINWLNPFDIAEVLHLIDLLVEALNLLFFFIVNMKIFEVDDEMCFIDPELIYCF